MLTGLLRGVCRLGGVFHSSRMHGRRRSPSCRPSFESLENRNLQAAGLHTSLSATGVLQILGTPNADTVLLYQADDGIHIKGQKEVFAADQVKSIVIKTGGGDDL